MLVLLPPSEKKSEPTTSASPLDLGALSFPELTEHREHTLDALTRLSRGAAGKALSTLKLTAGQRDELVRNAAVRDAPANRVSALYTGVLYDALGYPTLDTSARRRADRRLVVVSALFGALRPTDRVPPYRLSGGVTLPRLGVVTSGWRAHLEPVLSDAAGKGVVLDLRSGAYSPMWQPRGDLAERTVTVRVLHERSSGDPSSRAVVSHFNKATKGRIVRELLGASSDPRSVDDVIDALSAPGRVVDAHPVVAGRPRKLDLVVTEL